MCNILVLYNDSAVVCFLTGSGIWCNNAAVFNSVFGQLLKQMMRCYSDV